MHDRQFLLHYQPQLNGDSEVVGVEALVCWQHPQRGMVLPDEFIPLAEDTGLILTLERWVLQTPCEKLVRLGREHTNQLICMSANVTALQLRESDFTVEVLEPLQKTGAGPQCLKIELTESVLVDRFDILIDKISDLKEHGVCFLAG